MPIQLSQQLEGSFRNKDLTMSFFIYLFFSSDLWQKIPRSSHLQDFA